MVCVTCPTAIAAAVITPRLSGSAASLTTYTLITNIGAAVTVPTFFPLIRANPDISFMGAFLVTLNKVSPLLICPSLVAWFLQKFTPKIHQILLSYHELAFCLWGIFLAIVAVQTIYSLINDPADGLTEIMTAVTASITCCSRSFLGRTSGSVCNDRIGGG